MLKINSLNKPSYIVDKDFDNWVNRFKKVLYLKEIIDFVNDIDNDDILLEICFSDEEILRTYGKYTIKEIVEKIKNVYDLGKKIESELDRAENEYDITSIFERHYREINNNPKINYDRFRDYVYDLLNDAYKTFKVLGTYNRNFKRITFYYKSIEEDYMSYHNTEKINNVYEIVFSHELFHAFHFNADSSKAKVFFLEDELDSRTDYSSLTVTESCAKYFENKYCEKYFPHSTYRFLLTSIFSRGNPVYNPYSGYRYIENDTDFIEIINESFVDIDMALRIMFKKNPEIFYDIKNKKEYLRKEKVKFKETDYKELFKEYLICNEILSVSSYFSYIKSAFEKCLPLDIKDDTLSFIDHESRMYLVEYILGEYNKKVISKTITDYEKKILSGVKQLYKFLIENENTWNGANIISLLKKLLEVDKVFTGDDLRTNFLLKTNNLDRFYSNYSMPFSVLNKIFSSEISIKNYYYHEYFAIVKELINKMCFYDSLNNKILLVDINEIKFNKGNVTITLNDGSEYDVYYEKDKVVLEKLSTDLLDDIYIDFDNTSINYIEKNINSYPELHKLSIDYLDFKNRNKINDMSLSKAYYSNIYKYLKLNNDDLMDEVIGLYSNISFVVVLKATFISKNKKHI